MDLVQTTLVIGNAHCPSCVSTIESILSGYYIHPERSSSHRTSLEKVVDSLRIPGRAAQSINSFSSSATDDIEILDPAFRDVNVSLLNGTLTFSHPRGYGLKGVIGELEDAGFEVYRTGNREDIEDGRHQHLHSSKWSRFADLFTTSNDGKKEQAHKDNCAACRQVAEAEEEKNSKGKQKRQTCSLDVPTSADGRDSGTEVIEAVFAIDGMTCGSCVASLESGLSPQKNEGVLSVSVHLLDNSATIVYEPSKISEADLLEVIDDLGFEGTLQSSKPSKRPVYTLAPASSPSKALYRVVLSIHGMTCSSCVSAVNATLAHIPEVESFNIDLMSSSGEITVTEESAVPKIQEEIEDAGYEVKVMEVKALTEMPRESEKESKAEVAERTVDVRIDGFFCEHCPAKANAVLESLSTRFDIKYTSSTLADPTSSLTYTANPPEFTLRTIRTAITELGFTLSVVEAATLQDRARLAQKRERDRIAIRLVICVLFCIPTFIIGVVAPSLLPMHTRFRMYWDEPVWGEAPRYAVALLALATPVQFGIGQYFYVRAYKSLRGVWRRRRGKVDMRKVWLDRLLRWGSMDTLVALGSSVAWASSLAYLILDVTRPGPATMGSADTSVFLITFILAGRYLESISKQKTGDALLELGKLRPKKGLLSMEGRAPEEVDSPFIELGDCLLIPVGSSPPVDCILAKESSLTSFDEASLTGESRPVAKKPGDTIYAGTHNSGPSACLAIVTHRSGSTVIDSIVNGVRDAMGKKASIEKIAERITAVFVPAIVAIACFTFVVWILRGYTGDLPAEWLADQKGGGWALFSFQFSVAVLVVACPCGLSLAAPTANLIGVGLCAKNGIMPNGGGEAFQAFSKLDAICFDKTGTITQGSFRVSEHVLSLSSTAGIDEATFWRVMTIVEGASSHPIALALSIFAGQQVKEQVPPLQSHMRVTELEEVPGRGMVAAFSIDEPSITSCEVLIGNEKMLLERGVTIDDESRRTLLRWQGQGQSIVLVALASPADAGQHKLCAMLAVTDPIRPEAHFILKHFKAKGIKTYIVSGDGVATVQAVGRVLGLDAEQVVGGTLPDDKQRFVERLQENQIESRTWYGRKATRKPVVAFVGDGINDSIALAQANVSIAMGGGSQAAISTSDFSLIGNSLLSILILQSISRATYRRIITNFLWASIYNVILIPLAAGAFYELGRTSLPPVWASLAMALSSVSVVCSSLALKWMWRVPKEIREYRERA